MPLLAPPETPEPWFEVTVDEDRRLIKLSFEQDTYVRFFSRAQLSALVVELDAALEQLGPEPAGD
jgi:hypothetical protein